MGGVLGALFGGSKSKSTSTSESGNNAFGFLKDALGGNVSTGSNAMSSIAALLGQGGDKAGADSAFKNYLGSSGYNFMLDSGSRALSGNAATKGALNSGATLRGITQFGQDTGATKFDNYLTQLQGLVSGGAQSANTIAGAGQFSRGTGNSTGSSQNGIIPGLFG